ncbi:hypothetical protein MC885_015128 [Smutsia gigantea]|nr:hypothetical protein MC885_015128 [Smutsia gigantea]
MAPLPAGIRFIFSFSRDQWYKSTVHQILGCLALLPAVSHSALRCRYGAFILLLTFLLYASFHLSRKPISIVKREQEIVRCQRELVHFLSLAPGLPVDAQGELHRYCAALDERDVEFHGRSQSAGATPHPLLLGHTTDCGWAPFDRDNYQQLLGALDYSFLCAYAVGMYLSGILGERLPIRCYLTCGMLASGAFTALFGLGYFYNIHSFGFYVVTQVMNGLVQTTGWPSVVTCLGNWFGKGRWQEHKFEFGAFQEFQQKASVLSQLECISPEGDVRPTARGAMGTQHDCGPVSGRTSVCVASPLPCRLLDVAGPVRYTDRPASASPPHLSSCVLLCCRRGLIMGVWNSHTSMGNILGSLIAGYWVSTCWGLSFVVPGAIVAAMGMLCFLFLIEHPKDIACSSTLAAARGSENGAHRFRLQKQVPADGKTKPLTVSGANESCGSLASPGPPGDTSCLVSSRCHPPQDPEMQCLLPSDGKRSVHQNHIIVLPADGGGMAAISFTGALRIPGVIEFSLCLLFAKLVSYTFLFWLPLYITSVDHLDAREAGELSTLFDVGGIFGGILAGVISDRLEKRASTCGLLLLLAAPTLYMFSTISRMGQEATVAMLLLSGALVSGPYALITTAVSADLGTHKSLKGNSHALATVTAIIDSTGSVARGKQKYMAKGSICKRGVGPQSAQPLLSVTGGLNFVLGAVPDPPYTQRAELSGVSDGGPNAV